MSVVSFPNSMPIFYDFIFLIIAIAYLPIYLFRRKFHPEFWQRLGFLPQGLKPGRPIWIHAVSVGEVVAARPLFARLKKSYPDKQFVISTVTPTGNRIAKSMAGEGDLVTFLPLDFSFIVKRVINEINPSLFIIVETEIWPNLILALQKKNVPIVSLNVRISDRSFRGYRRIKWLLQPVLNKISLFCAQTARDAERLARLGVSSDKVKVTGNMKFDLNDYTDYKNDCTDYRLKLGLNSGERLWVAGSTHPGEEEILLGVYKELRAEFTELRLLLAPRHAERSRAIADIVLRFGFRAMLVSGLPGNCPACSSGAVFILDRLGELASFYNAADIVFVGGSLVKKGGHNILEPAAAGKPVVFGPQMFNFRDIAELFLKNDAALMAADAEELKGKISLLLGNPVLAAGLASRASGVILENRGATQRNLELLREFVL